MQSKGGPPILLTLCYSEDVEEEEITCALLAVPFQ